MARACPGRAYAACARRSRVRALAAAGDVSAPPPPVALVVDLSFANEERRWRSVATQLSWCVGCWRRAGGPSVASLRFCSWGGRPALEAAAASFNAEAWGAALDARPVEEALEGTPRVVFLSPDAKDALEDVARDGATAYVVGGLVDSPVVPGVSLAKAERLGWDARRLPLQEVFPDGTSRVLSVNAALDALLRRAAGEAWEDALREAVPKRFHRERPKRANRVRPTSSAEARLYASAAADGDGDDPA